MGKLTDDMTVKAYQKAFAQGYDHSYPNENIVRLEAGAFGPQKGRCLDYGFGFGENLLHLAAKGYEMHGLDIERSLIERVHNKIATRGLKLPHAPKLDIIDGSTARLPYPDAFFDSILSNQVVYLLADEDKIRFLFSEFRRVVKPGGRLLVTLMGEKNICCAKGRYIGNNVYEYDDASKMNKIEGDFTHRYYIAHSEPHIRYLFDGFVMDEIGYFDNSYLGISGHHYVVMCHAPE